MAAYYNLRQELNQITNEVAKIQGQKLLYGLFKSASSPSEQRDIVDLERLLGPYFDHFVEVRKRYADWSTQVDIYTSQFKKAPVVRSFTSAKSKVQRMLDSRRPDVRLIIAKINELAAGLDALNNSAAFLVRQEKPKRIREHKPLSSDSKMLTPLTPFSNKIAFWDTIKSCDRYLHWVDKYFSIAGLRMLSEGLDKDKVKEIKILVSVDKADEGLRSLFKDFRDEMGASGMLCEMRVIVDPKVKTAIHDRWIVSASKCFNVPSPDTVERGQFSEIKSTQNIPPFNDWWETGLDIVNRWNEIRNVKSNSKQSRAGQ